MSTSSMEIMSSSSLSSSESRNLRMMMMIPKKKKKPHHRVSFDMTGIIGKHNRSFIKASLIIMANKNNQSDDGGVAVAVANGRRHHYDDQKSRSVSIDEMLSETFYPAMAMLLARKRSSKDKDMKRASTTTTGMELRRMEKESRKMRSEVDNNPFMDFGEGAEASVGVDEGGPLLLKISALSTLPSPSTSNNGPVGVEMVKLDERGWTPSLEEKECLYKEKSVLVKAEEAGQDPMETTLFRVEEVGDEHCPNVGLRRFVPYNMQFKVHFAANEDLQIIPKDDVSFYFRYQPVYIMVLNDSEDIPVIQYLNIPRILPNLLRILKEPEEVACRIVADLDTLVDALVEDHWKTGFIKSRVSDNSIRRNNLYKAAWDRLDDAITIRVEAFRVEFHLLARSRIWKILHSCPELKGNDLLGEVAGETCKMCCSVDMPVGFRAKQEAFPYDEYDFSFKTDDRKFRKCQVLDLCKSCGILIEPFHNLMHFKFFVHKAVNIHIKEHTSRLKDGEFLDKIKTIRSLVSDYEWNRKIYLDFQVSLFEADRQLVNIKNIKKNRSN